MTYCKERYMKYNRKFPETTYFYGNLVLQATLPGTKRPSCMVKTCFHYNDRSNLAEFLEFFYESYQAEDRFEIMEI